MEYDLLKESKYHKITNSNYSWDYGDYIKENKVIFGLGIDLDLTEFKDSTKELKHVHETSLKRFLNIKKGDYIEWIMVERVDTEENRFLKCNQILGVMERDFYEGYEFIKNRGHALPIRVIAETNYVREFTDLITFHELRDVNQLSEFAELEGFSDLKNKETTKWYIKFDFFGLENIKSNESEMQVKFEYIFNESTKRSILENMKKVQKDQYIVGEFISKNNERVEVSRVIGKVKEINIEESLILTVDKISEENKEFEYTALTDIFVYEGNNVINFINKNLRDNKNIIFYGPPGTGKTYNVADEIIKIITPSVIMNKKIDRYKLNNAMKKLQAEDRVKFCTFHQSYGYEEFIEGLRSDGNGNFIVEDGVLKEIAIEAMFEGLVYECKRDILNNKSHLSTEELKKKKKEEVMKYINEGSKFDFFNCAQYVIVIDEINRGNISRVFGELITLLEESKRLCQENELILKLPYSKEDFALPPNLHLIGTMNTSDKSIAPIDIALRRRFKFVEMMPKEEILPNIDGIDLHRMLKKLNDRIEYLYDRDHKIGHAYFVNLSNLKGIIETFKNKIIPLLQEYFYEDFYKVGLILGGIGTSKDDKYIVYKKESNPKDLFSGAIDGDFPIVEKYYIKYEFGLEEILNIYA